MTDQRHCYAGVDWASESHHVFLTDGDGRKIGERVFRHGGEGLAEMAAWLMATSGAIEGDEIQVAIEVPHGPVVETLMERGFKVHAINPKQMDRFRDRFTLAGAKDDSRDAEVMASALRTDPRCFRLLAVADPVVIELREWSRIAEDLSAERNRLTNRMREQLWRYFPALLELENDLGAEWLLDLWETVPTPDKVARIREATIAKLLKRHRIRRFDAARVLDILRQPPLKVVLATLLAEAFDALQRRDYAALRSLTGVAPVTKRSGKSCIVVRRQACHDRLANAMYHWARVAVQRDLRSRLKYAALRSRGHGHGRALRSVADRLLAVACAMLKTGTTFDPSLAAQKSAC
ncbi:transposase [Ensifer aridi]|uniref:IS110 family transposase n=1 Tax=Ensifer aridi TaxID=1708715 RepID=UPI00358EB270